MDIRAQHGRAPLDRTPARAMSDSSSVRALSLFLAVVAGYFLARALSRTLMGGGLELDEAEQLVLTQQLLPGYNDQPPLYAWLQWLVFQVTGPSIGGLAILKAALLCGTYGFTAAAALRVIRSPWRALAAAAMLILIPQIGWESQRDLTNSVLVTTGAAATVWAALRLFDRRRTTDYAVLGLAMAACFLGKYNGLIMLSALCTAGLSMPRLRPTLLDRRVLLTGLVFLLVTGPHLVWLLSGATPVFAEKLVRAGSEGFVGARLDGLWQLFKSVVEFAVAPVLVVGLLTLRPGPTEGKGEANRTHVRLLMRTFLLALAFMAAGAAVFGVEGFKDRWQQPVMFYLPMLAVAAWPQRFTRRVCRRVVIAAGAVGALILVAMPLRLWLIHGNPQDQNAQIRSLSHPLQRMLNGRTPLVVAEDAWLGGSLRLLHPDWPVAVPGFPVPSGGEVETTLALWDGSAAIPIRVEREVRRLAGPLDRVLPVELTFRWTGGTRRLFLGLADGEPAVR